MSNLGAGIPVYPYGATFEKRFYPVKASAQIYEGALVCQVSGYCATGTTASGGDAIGVATHDQLGTTDGAKFIEVMTNGVFLFAAGVAAPTVATPIGTPLFMEDDHTVGTGGLGATQKKAGSFDGIEDDGRIRVRITNSPASSNEDWVNGTALTDTATTTVQRAGRRTRYLLAGTMSQGETVTLGTTGAVQGDIIKIVRTSTSAQTLAVVNGGAGAGTLCTLVASKVGWAQAYFDGTNWLFDGCSAT